MYSFEDLKETFQESIFSWDYFTDFEKNKATAGEYQYLNDFVKSQGIEFIWITDGKGWLTALNPLEETFNHNDYVVNLDMVKSGVLEEICLK